MTGGISQMKWLNGGGAIREGRILHQEKQQKQNREARNAHVGMENYRYIGNPETRRERP